jgi:hypothetical protein
VGYSTVWSVCELTFRKKLLCLTTCYSLVSCSADFAHEDGNDSFLRNVGSLTDYTAHWVAEEGNILPVLHDLSHRRHLKAQNRKVYARMMAYWSKCFCLLNRCAGASAIQQTPQYCLYLIRHCYFRLWERGLHLKSHHSYCTHMLCRRLRCFPWTSVRRMTKNALK